jgi:hypothetical protein
MEIWKLHIAHIMQYIKSIEKLIKTRRRILKNESLMLKASIKVPCFWYLGC